MRFLFSFLLLFPALIFAQNPLEIVYAEKSFAAHAVAKGTVNAFLQYMDTTAIMFEKGKPINAWESWQKKENRPGVLNWYPQYVEMAASGDFGFSTGPWTFQPKTISDSIIARGYFFTIWRKNQQNEWKFLLDIGLDSTPASTDSFTTVWKGVSRLPQKHKKQSSYLDAEQAFIQMFSQRPQKAYPSFLSKKSILLRNDHLPALNKDSQLELLDKTDKATQFMLVGYGLSKTGDQGYVYGNVIISGKQHNYVRVWRLEKEGWKIAAELIL